MWMEYYEQTCGCTRTRTTPKTFNSQEPLKFFTCVVCEKQGLVYCGTCGTKAERVHPDEPASILYLCKNEHQFEHGIR